MLSVNGVGGTPIGALEVWASVLVTGANTAERLCSQSALPTNNTATPSGSSQRLAERPGG